MTSGASWSAAAASVSVGVSGPRNVTRQPRSRSARPRMMSPRSWRSPDGQASSARGPAPRSQPRARPSSRARSRPVAKCSCATEASPSRPAVAEFPQVGQDGRLRDSFDAECRHEPVEGGLRARVVEPVERGPQRCGEIRRSAVLRLGRRRLADHSGCLGGRQSLCEVGLHRSHARLVVVGVEPVAAGGAHRREERVAALPRAEEVDADAGAPRELTDAKRGGCHAVQHSRRTNNEQGLDRRDSRCLAVHSLFSVCPVLSTKGAP